MHLFVDLFIQQIFKNSYKEFWDHKELWGACYVVRERLRGREQWVTQPGTIKGICHQKIKYIDYFIFSFLLDSSKVLKQKYVLQKY